MPRTLGRLSPLLVALAALAAGCAGGGPLTERRATLGTLKADVARLEGQNRQGRARLAELEADKRRIAEQLSQEREANGELTARLDDARDLLARQGTSVETASPAEPRDTFDRVEPPSSRVRSSGRKPPFAQIGGGRRAVAAPDDEDIPAPGEAEEIEADPEPVSRRPAADPPRGEESLRWLPVSTGLSEPTAKRR